MILNRTNAKAIEKVANSGLVEDWVGVGVTLYVEKGVKAFGDVVDALRIRDKKPTETKMTDTIFESMMMAIDQGKAAQVEMAIPKYKMNKEMSALILKKIKESKK